MERTQYSRAGSGRDWDEVSGCSNGLKDEEKTETNAPDEAMCQADDQIDQLPSIATPALSKREKWELLPVIVASNILIGVDYLFFPMFYVELVNHFQVPRATLGWPKSIHKWCSMFSGMNKFKIIKFSSQPQNYDNVYYRKS